MRLAILVKGSTNVQWKVVLVDQVLPYQLALHTPPVLDTGVSSYADGILHPLLDDIVADLETAKCIPMEIRHLQRLSLLQTLGF